MKKLSKNMNAKKTSIEAYDVYFSHGCSCKSYCDGNSRSSYVNFKGLQVE